jgi:hypothetical protein
VSALADRHLLSLVFRVPDSQQAWGARQGAGAVPALRCNLQRAPRGADRQRSSGEVVLRECSLDPGLQPLMDKTRGRGAQVVGHPCLGGPLRVGCPLNATRPYWVIGNLSGPMKADLVVSRQHLFPPAPTCSIPTLSRRGRSETMLAVAVAAVHDADDRAPGAGGRRPGGVATTWLRGHDMHDATARAQETLSAATRRGYLDWPQVRVDVLGGRP